MRAKIKTESSAVSRSKWVSRAGLRLDDISYTSCVTVSAGLERRPICTVFGACWNSWVSASISFESVAENISVCRFRGRGLHNPPNLREEAHVEHPVRLVQHQEFHAREIRVARPDIQEPARRGDDQVHPGAQRLDLRPLPDTRRKPWPS